MDAEQYCIELPSKITVYLVKATADMDIASALERVSEVLSYFQRCIDVLMPSDLTIEEVKEELDNLLYHLTTYDGILEV